LVVLFVVFSVSTLSVCLFDCLIVCVSVIV
jgi:hypothetical protein